MHEWLNTTVVVIILSLQTVVKGVFQIVEHSNLLI